MVFYLISLKYPAPTIAVLYGTEEAVGERGGVVASSGNPRRSAPLSHFDDEASTGTSSRRLGLRTHLNSPTHLIPLALCLLTTTLLAITLY